MSRDTESLVVDFSRACYLRGQYDLAQTLLQLLGDKAAIMLPELHGILTRIAETPPPPLPHSIAPVTPKPRQWRCVATRDGVAAVAFFVTAATLDAARAAARLQYPNAGTLDITEEG